MTEIQVCPRLIVSGADRALDFYQAVFGARVLERYDDDRGLVVHAAVRIGSSIVALADADPDGHNAAPPALGGSPVILSLTVPDADAVGHLLLAHGAEVIFPIADQFYGKREGRFRDPFGHLWIISQPLADLAPAEIQRRLRARGDRRGG